MELEKHYIRQFLGEAQNIKETFVDEQEIKDLNYYERKLKSNEIYISKVPDELKTPELCKIAVERTDYALNYVPDEIKKELNLDGKEQQ
mgnify:CR=1 FL=1